MCQGCGKNKNIKENTCIYDNNTLNLYSVMIKRYMYLMCGAWTLFFDKLVELSVFTGVSDGCRAGIFTPLPLNPANM